MNLVALSALMLLVGRHLACKNERWGAGMVICLQQDANLHMAQLMPLPLTVSCFSKIQMVLPFWHWLTRVVLDKGPLMYVCVCVCVNLVEIFSGKECPVAVLMKLCSKRVRLCCLLPCWATAVA